MPHPRRRRTRAKGRASTVPVPADEALARLKQAGLALSGRELGAFWKCFPRAYRHYFEHFSARSLLSAEHRSTYAMIEALETVYISDIPRLLGLSAAVIHRRFRLFHDRVLH